jgi:hypothetical protein
VDSPPRKEVHYSYDISRIWIRRDHDVQHDAEMDAQRARGSTGVAQRRNETWSSSDLASYAFGSG